MYVELHARSAFSFLRGASLPEQLAETAAELGFPAMGLLDRNGVYGAPRFFAKAKETGLRPIIGAELTMEDGSILPVLVETRAGYQNLCRVLTRANLRAPKNEGAVRWDELAEFVEGLVALTGDEEGSLIRALKSPVNRRETPDDALQRLLKLFGPDRLFVELQRHQLRQEERVIPALVGLAQRYALPLLATNGVLYATPRGRSILDVFTCIRQHTHLDAAGKQLSQNSERYLKSAADMRQLFSDLPGAIKNTMRLAERLQFSLENLGYEFPSYPCPPGESMESCLRQQVYAGAKDRYRDGLSEPVQKQLERELALINKLGFAGYFLIVADIVRFCRENNIMAQGRGSAANSAVCYSLGITAVDPVSSHLLFERFLSENRQGWPDIDIDLPSGDRRERVIQEIYQRYGKHGAAMTANVITYRGRSAAREIGKALNLPLDVLDRFSNLFASGDFPETLNFETQLQQAGLPRQHPRAAAFASLYSQIYCLPRHLGQHSGGMIICQCKLDAIVPLENASMAGRVVAQWDKDDCEDLGIIKVDLLGLGMMSVLQDAIELTRQRGHPIDLAHIPKDDPATFELMRKADTLGVFQIESRAQIATLPRLKPRCFYDVVIEVAIIRPGPIQGHLMHPYLARRAKKEEVSYYHPSLKPLLEPILGRTLGVPLFQEQMLKMAMVLADFSGSEAEELRRALSFHRSQDRMHKVEKKLRAAMARKEIEGDVMENIIQAITSFALYGFPESHAISFAILAYGSAYLKVHRTAEFYTGLLNNQPMGFYSPATLVKDAMRHGIKFRPVCALRSEWRCTIETDREIRLGFCMVQGLSAARAQVLLEERAKQMFRSLEDFKSRAGLNQDELRTLAEIGALNRFSKHRRDALWDVEKKIWKEDLFSNFDSHPPPVSSRSGGTLDSNERNGDSLPSIPKGDSPLVPMDLNERLQADYHGMQLSTGPHPMALLRPRLTHVWRASDLGQAKHGQTVQIAGNVICRQRPGTAKGFVFISLEDETGISNAIVAPKLFEEYRLVITQESFLLIEGKLQNSDHVVVVQARRIERLDHGTLAGSASYDFR